MDISGECRDVVVRLSIGSLLLLGYVDLKQKYRSRTIYILQYSESGCLGSCTYCFQNKYSSRSPVFLSRITWYPVNLSEIIGDLKKKNGVYDRICIQTILKKDFVIELFDIINVLRNNSVDKPISVALTPVHTSVLEKLRELGVDYIGVGLDTVTESLFRKYCKPYSWETYWKFIEESISVYGDRHVSVHLIIGMGETLRETLETMERAVNTGCNIALFPYIDSSLKPNLDVGYYRIIQISRYFLLKGYSLRELLINNKFRKDIVVDIFENIDKYIEVFLTCGCPACNRPYYTENPRGPFYNIYSIEHFNEYRNNLLRELVYVLESGLVE